MESLSTHSIMMIFTGLVGILKVILAHYHGIIPKNLHFIEPNPDIPSLRDGRLRVVDKNMPWEGGTACVNSFGFGGANVHVIIKTPVVAASPPAKPKHTSTLPLLMLCSGNTEETVQNCLTEWSKRKDKSLESGEMLNKQATDSLHYQPARGFAVPEFAIMETQLNEVKYFG